MTDIVERLRAHPGSEDSVTIQFRTMVAQRHEAADEIERLRAAIRKYLSHQLSHAESYKVFQETLDDRHR